MLDNGASVNRTHVSSGLQEGIKLEVQQPQRGVLTTEL